MNIIRDKDISDIEISNISDSLYKITFRENITEISSSEVTCDEYVTYVTSDESNIEEYVNNNKDALLLLAKQQDKQKTDSINISNMKLTLNNSDYKVIKNFESFMIGASTDDDLSSIIANRQLMRDSINNIENSVTDDDSILLQAKQRKINEMCLISQSTIINGITFNDKQYRLNTTDQINISALNIMAQAGNKVPYHADGEVCRIFEPEEMVQLAQAATAFVIYHTTYFNLLKHQILDYTTEDEINAVYYGISLKNEYQQIINTIANSSSDTSSSASDENTNSSTGGETTDEE